MSFRHTAITEFLYKYGEDMTPIKEVLNEYGKFTWVGGSANLGYFHGVIKDYDGYETKNQKKFIEQDIKKRTGIILKIIIEN